MGADDWDLHDGEGDAVVDKTVLHMQYNAADASYSVSNVKPGLYVIAANKQVKEYSYSGSCCFFLVLFFLCGSYFTVLRFCSGGDNTCGGICGIKRGKY